MEAKDLFSGVSVLRKSTGGVSMPRQTGWIRSLFGGLIVIVALLPVPFDAIAQPAGANGIRLADDVVPAPDGYETVTAKYVAASPTDLYISPFIWAGKVLGVHLNAGERVEVLAKAKGYQWLL